MPVGPAACSVARRFVYLRINGVDRIISFTGEDLPQGGHALRNVALMAVSVVPNVGTLVDWTRTAAHRLKPGSTGPEAIAAATHWRQSLDRMARRPG
jgi:hypothetical protein